VIVSLRLTFAASYIGNITDYKDVVLAIKAAVFRSTKISASNIQVGTSRSSMLCGVSIPPVYGRKAQALSLSVLGEALLTQQRIFDSKNPNYDLNFRRIHLTAAPDTSIITFAAVQNVPGIC
jgi:hypothetical protein